MQKRCPNCGIIYDNATQHFHVQKDKKDGLRAHCKICRTFTYHTNCDVIKRNARQYYVADRKTHLDRNAKWRSRNPDKMREYKRQWGKTGADFMSLGIFRY